MQEASPLPTDEQTGVIYPLRSIVDHLDIVSLFTTPKPLEVELGSGDGSFLINYAAQHPERNFLGVERLLGRLRKIDRKGRRAGLANLRGIRIESAYFLQYLLPPGSIRALHIYFPDPWPKRKHWKNRLINEHFPELARNALEPEGVIYLRTDNRPYFEQMKTNFAAHSGFREVDTPAELRAILTDFERGFLAKGIATQRAAYQKIYIRHLSPDRRRPYDHRTSSCPGEPEHAPHRSL